MAYPPFLSWYARSLMIFSSAPTAYLPASLPISLDLANPTFMGGCLGPLPLLLAAFSAASSAPLAISFPGIMNNQVVTLIHNGNGPSAAAATTAAPSVPSVIIRTNLPPTDSRT